MLACLSLFQTKWKLHIYVFVKTKKKKQWKNAVGWWVAGAGDREIGQHFFSVFSWICPDWSGPQANGLLNQIGTEVLPEKSNHQRPTQKRNKIMTNRKEKSIDMNTNILVTLRHCPMWQFDWRYIICRRLHSCLRSVFFFISFLF